MLFYTLLPRARLVPRWRSGWGLVGAASTIVASLLVMFGLVEVVTTTYEALNVPMVVQELVLAIWLVARGFEPSALEAAYTQVVAFGRSNTTSESDSRRKRGMPEKPSFSGREPT